MTEKKKKKTQPRNQRRKSPECDDFRQVNMPQQLQGLPDRVIKRDPGAWVHSPPEHQILQHAFFSASFQDQPCCPAPGSLPDTGDWCSSRANVSICFSSLHKFFQGGHFSQPRNPHYAPTDYFPAPRGPSLRVLTICVSWSHSLPVQNLLERLLNPWPTPTLCFNSVFYHFIILILFHKWKGQNVSTVVNPRISFE